MSCFESVHKIKTVGFASQFELGISREELELTLCAVCEFVQRMTKVCNRLKAQFMAGFYGSYTRPIIHVKLRRCLFFFLWSLNIFVYGIIEPHLDVDHSGDCKLPPMSCIFSSAAEKVSLTVISGFPTCVYLSGYPICDGSLKRAECIFSDEFSSQIIGHCSAFDVFYYQDNFPRCNLRSSLQITGVSGPARHPRDVILWHDCWYDAVNSTTGLEEKSSCFEWQPTRWPDSVVEECRVVQ